MILKTFLPILLFLSINAYACDGAEEIIWQKDTLPFRDYLPINRYFKPFSFYSKNLSYQGGTNTACYSFIQNWKIINDSLFLDNIKGCNHRTYIIDNKSLDSLKKQSVPQDIIYKIEVLKDRKYLNTEPIFDELKKLISKNTIEKYSAEIFQAISKHPNDRNYLDFKQFVKKKYLNKNLFFYNYSGIISIGVGKPIDSLLIYWHNPTEKDLFFIINNGIVTDTYYVNSVHYDTDTKGKELFIHGYKLFLPDNFVQSDSIHRHRSSIFPTIKRPDTSLTYIDTLSSSTIQIVLNCKTHLWERQKQHLYQKDLINKEMSTLSNYFCFSGYNFLKINYNGSFRNEPDVPGICWVNGKGKNNKRIKIITVSTNVAVIEILFSTDNLTDETFDTIFNNMVRSISCTWMRGLHEVR
jgi:hypothetical protein